MGCIWSWKKHDEIERIKFIIFIHKMYDNKIGQKMYHTAFYFSLKKL